MGTRQHAAFVAGGVLPFLRAMPNMYLFFPLGMKAHPGLPGQEIPLHDQQCLPARAVENFYPDNFNFARTGRLPVRVITWPT